MATANRNATRNGVGDRVTIIEADLYEPVSEDDKPLLDSLVGRCEFLVGNLRPLWATTGWAGAGRCSVAPENSSLGGRRYCCRSRTSTASESGVSPKMCRATPTRVSWRRRSGSRSIRIEKIWHETSSTMPTRRHGVGCRIGLVVVPAKRVSVLRQPGAGTGESNRGEPDVPLADASLPMGRVTPAEGRAAAVPGGRGGVAASFVPRGLASAPPETGGDLLRRGRRRRTGRFHEGAGRLFVFGLEDHQRRSDAVLTAAGEDEEAFVQSMSVDERNGPSPLVRRLRSTPRDR